MKIKELQPGEEIALRLKKEDKILSLIKEHCQTAHQTYLNTHKILTRGIDKNYLTANEFIGRSRENRTPIVMNEIKAKKLNSAFSELGFNARRDNSIFCSSNKNAYKMFGTAFYIFPIDPFDFTWSPIVKDINIDMPLRSAINDNNYDIFKLWNEGQYNELIKYCEYSKTDFNEAVLSENEVMIHGKYLGLSYEDYSGFVIKLYNLR